MNWKPLILFAAPLYLWGAAHGVWTRTPGDFWNASLFIGIPLAFLIFGIIVSIYSKIEDRPETNFSASEIFFSFIFWLRVIRMVLVFSFLISLLIYPLLAFIFDASDWLSSPQEIGVAVVVVGSVLTLYLGGLLFFFRLRLRSTYGITEATAGVLVVAHRISGERIAQLLDPNLLFLILTAGIYLVVRGFDNVHQGLIGNPPDPLATKIKNSLITHLKKGSSSENS